MPAAAYSLRPLGVAELLDGAVRLARSGARIAVPIAVPFAIARAALGVAVGYATIDSPESGLVNLLGEAFALVLLGTLLGGVLAPLFGGEVLGATPDGRALWAQVRRRLGALTVLAVVVALAEEAGLIALVIGGVWLWGVWAVAAPALMLEGIGTLGALRRSFALVRHYFWRTWGLRALGWLLTFVLSLLITLPFQAAAGWVTRTNPFTIATSGVSDARVYLGILAIGTVLATVVVAPISAAIDVLLYVDLRMRAEGLDIVLGLPTGAARPEPGTGLA